MEEHTSEQILKNQEGTMYALGALAEVMQKMNERFDVQAEHDQAIRKEQEEAEIQKAETEARDAFVNEIAQAVLNQVQELNADKERSVSKKHSWPIKGGGTEDAQVEHKLMSDTDKVQMPIVAGDVVVKGEDATAIQKHDVMYADDEMEESAELPVVDDGEEEDGKGYGMARKDHHDEEEPVMEDDEEEEEVRNGYPMSEMKMLAKQLEAVTKELNALKSGYSGNIETKAAAMADATLQKQGWTKELAKEPRQLPEQSFGLADIQKSQDSQDVVGQMASMSWNELNNM